MLSSNHIDREDIEVSSRVIKPACLSFMEIVRQSIEKCPSYNTCKRLTMTLSNPTASYYTKLIGDSYYSKEGQTTIAEMSSLGRPGRVSITT